MAKRAAYLPGWAKTIGAMLDNKVLVRVDCTSCKVCRDVDLAKIVSIKGRDYSLWNRRCRCRLTKLCQGWNCFHYMHGVMRPLWDDAREDIWSERDWRARQMAPEIMQRHEEARRRKKEAERR